MALRARIQRGGVPLSQTSKNGAPKILEQFKDKPYTLELRNEFTMGNKPKSLPTIKTMHYHGKPATCKVLEHFVRTTPVVEKCDDPRCFSRLVIVPKREPGSTKDSPPTSYRVTMDALINHCLKPVGVQQVKDRSKSTKT
jgi:hypothetical protein